MDLFECLCIYLIRKDFYALHVNRSWLELCRAAHITMIAIAAICSIFVHQEKREKTMTKRSTTWLHQP